MEFQLSIHLHVPLLEQSRQVNWTIENSPTLLTKWGYASIGDF